MRLNKHNTVNKEWFESKTRSEQVDYVSNLIEYKNLPEKQKKQKVKDILDGVSYRNQKQVSEDNTNSSETGSIKTSRKKRGSNKSKES